MATALPFKPVHNVHQVGVYMVCSRWRYMSYFRFTSRFKFSCDTLRQTLFLSNNLQYLTKILTQCSMDLVNKICAPGGAPITVMATVLSFRIQMTWPVILKIHSTAKRACMGGSRVDLSSKHETLAQLWFTVDPSSTTLAQLNSKPTLAQRLMFAAAYSSL